MVVHEMGEAVGDGTSLEGPENKRGNERKVRQASNQRKLAFATANQQMIATTSCSTCFTILFIQNCGEF
jgi:hypothetical protein